MAGTLVKVRLTGQAQWTFPETTPTTAGFGLWLFAQNAAVDVQPYSFESVPFVVRTGRPDIVLCAYQRYVTDEAAVYALPVGTTQPRCKLARTAVKRGTAVSVTCNASGRMTTKFRRDGRTRSQTITVGSSGKVRLATRLLTRGTHRVTFAIGEPAMGTGTLRVA